VLQHPVFSSFGDALFRLSDYGRKPALIVDMHDREASLPIDGLMREFRIDPVSDDGAMLGLISRALVFVTGLRMGEWLPAEVLTGEASWALDDAYRERSLGRFNLCLLAWMLDGASSVDRVSISQAGMRPMSAESLASGLRLMATKVGEVTPDEALLRIRRVAEEFAYIESLRDRLLRGAGRMLSALDRLSRTFRGDVTHKELLSQVRRLGAIGLADLQARFDRVDAEVSDIERVVVDSARLVELVRRHRDDLYVRCRAWDPFLSEWGVAEVGPSTRTWHLAHDIYRFLAPRFMTVVEWQSVPDFGDRGGAGSGMAW
jgi:hypothetical protein